MDTLLVCYFFWYVHCSMPQSKCTSPVLQPCILNTVSPILFRTVFACSVSFAASRTLRVLPHLAVCQLRTGFMFLSAIIWLDVQPMGLVVLEVSLGGSEVPGCPSFGNLRSPSPERLGGSHLPGCHGSVPAVLVFLRPFPANF